MSVEAWDFDEFSNWLIVKANQYRHSGAEVELQKNEKFGRTIRLKIEYGVKVGELTVWGDGRSSQAIIDLKAGEFIFMKDDVYIGSEWESQLMHFFECIDN